jgi:hypothetical protein
MSLSQKLTTGIVISPISGNDTDGGIVSGSRLLLETGVGDGILLETGSYILKEN